MTLHNIARLACSLIASCCPAVRSQQSSARRMRLLITANRACLCAPARQVLPLPAASHSLRSSFVGTSLRHTSGSGNLTIREVDLERLGRQLLSGVLSRSRGSQILATIFAGFAVATEFTRTGRKAVIVEANNKRSLGDTKRGTRRYGDDCCPS